MSRVLTLYVCRECARPSLFREDRCCSGCYDIERWIPEIQVASSDEERDKTEVTPVASLEP